jgi:hypothetical protein
MWGTIDTLSGVATDYTAQAATWTGNIVHASLVAGV